MPIRKCPYREVITVDSNGTAVLGSTSTSFTAKVPTTTKPSGDGTGVIETGYPGTRQHDEILLIPFGSDANNETFDFRVWAWSPNVTPGLSSQVWIPRLLADVSVTLGNIAASMGTNTFMADTVSLNEGDTNHVIVENPTDADSNPAWVRIKIEGEELLEFDFDSTASATSNCLYRFIDTTDS